MIGYLILVISLLLFFFSYERKKESLSLFLLFFFYAPAINIGNLKGDSTYIYLLVIFLWLLIKEKRLMFTKTAKMFFFIALYINLCYLFSWLVFSKEQVNEVLITLIGNIKVPFGIILAQTIWKRSRCIGENSLQILDSFFEKITIINFAAVFYQKSFPISAYNFFSHLYNSSSQSYYRLSNTYAETTIYNGHFTRYYGTFENPMLLGIASSFILTFFIYKLFWKKNNNLSLWIFLFLNTYNGILSDSKSFILSVPIIIIFSLLLLFKDKLNIKKILTLVVTLAIMFIVIIKFDFFVLKLSNIFPKINGLASYLKNPIMAFETRLGENGAIVPLIEVIKDNLLSGVGPIPIAGERIMDNSYLVIVHNGGIIALVPLIAFFIKILVNNLKRKYYLSFLLQCVHLAVSVGLTVILGSSMTIPIYFIILTPSFNYSLQNNKKFREDKINYLIPLQSK